MILLFLFAVLGQVADMVTFAQAVAKNGPLGEANPLVSWLYEFSGIYGVSAVKAAFLLFVIGSAYWMTTVRTPLWVPAAGLVFAGIVGLFGAATNVWALLR
jgi:hypothetical protein